MSITTKGLTKIFLRGQPNEVVAVNEVNLSMKEGDFTAILGLSGSGKSTLLNLMGLLTYPTRGDVYYGDIPVTRYSEGRRTSVRRENVGFIFQQYNLLLHLSSWENVALPLICRGIAPSVRRNIAVDFLTQLGMGDRVEFRVGHLSGGEQQRVAIARALVTEPKIIFADEPTASVDDANARLIIELFKRLKKEGRTIIVSTHDPTLSREATRTLTINHGRLTEDN
jgi:putative ABC transport system ATP-binding protein